MPHQVIFMDSSRFCIKIIFRVTGAFSSRPVCGTQVSTKLDTIKLNFLIINIIAKVQALMLFQF